MKKMDASRKLHVSAVMIDELIAPYGQAQPHILEKVTRLLVELGQLRLDLHGIEQPLTMHSTRCLAEQSAWGETCSVPRKTPSGGGR